MTVFPFLPLLLLLLNSWILFLFTFVLPTFLPLVFIFLVDFIFWSFSLFWFQCWLGGKNQLSILFFGFLLFVFPLLALLLLVCRHLCFSSTSRCTLKLALFFTSRTSCRSTTCFSSIFVFLDVFRCLGFRLLGSHLFVYTFFYCREFCNLLLLFYFYSLLLLSSSPFLNKS